VARGRQLAVTQTTPTDDPQLKPGLPHGCKAPPAADTQVVPLDSPRKPTPPLLTEEGV